MRTARASARIFVALAILAAASAAVLVASIRPVLAPHGAWPASSLGSESLANLVAPSEATVAVADLLARKHAGSYADPAGPLNIGETFAVDDNKGAWWRVRLPDGNNVWADGSGLDFPALRASGWNVRYREDAAGNLSLDAVASLGAPRDLPARLRLVQADGGRWTFTAEGVPTPSTIASPDPRTISLRWPVRFSTEAAGPRAVHASPAAAASGWYLPIHDGEFQDLILEPGQLLIRFQRTPAWRVESFASGTVQLTFRRELAGLTRADGAVSLVLHGDGQSRDARVGGQLWVVLPDTDVSPALSRSGAAGAVAGLPIRREGGDLWVATGITGNYTLRADGDVVTATPVGQGLAGRLVAIDPGHGGSDRGAPGGLFGLREKDVNLAVALALGRKLERDGARIVYTRTGDNALVSGEEELGARTRLMDEARPDVVISIHHDWSGDPAARGGASYWSPLARNQEASRVLAADLQKAMVAQLGVRDNGTEPQRFFVITNVNEPAALVELGFLSNRGDARRILRPDYAERAAEALRQGLAAYFAGP